MLVECSAKELTTFYSEVRHYTERICKPLEIEDYVPQPVVDVSPPKWHLAHTTWFFEEFVLRKFLKDYRPFDEKYRYLFNSYYNSVGDKTPRNQRGFLSRPTVAEVFRYRSYVDEKMLRFLEKELPDEAKELVILGINHEQQHQELLLTDLKYILHQNPLFPAYKEDFAPEEITESQKPDFVVIEQGVYEIGFSGKGFCFDNELGRHKVFLHDFSIRNTLVTNAEYLEFMEDGGYRNFNLWHSEGWDWINQNRIEAPLYWHKIDGEWFNFTLSGLRKIKPEAPITHVSFYEASAFAEWKGMRLPTEFEWEVASDLFNWGLRWEWTNSAYLPYPFFKKLPGAVGEYNGKFMVNQMVLRGASIATPTDHSRKTYRNFFHPHLRWQFTGIRLARSIE
ncbi:MAG: ergothioneine biosynthesis protein EgtB [Acidobacteria bacterium]|nr:MAG: ergothioneine biosynthesis protein EgtB [Acidobacteriota bacterium]GIU82617.1 MAG: ergothioneine biosynthesis protein EgtB [Pyrinomonadaceae bacterium]